MQINKKCLVVFFSVFILMSLVGIKAMAVNTSDAVDTGEIKRQIALLQAQIAVLLQQLEGATPQPVVWCHNFNTKLGFGSMGAEVEHLQRALQKEGLYNGAFDSNYGQQVASAVTGFQQKYYADTLAPWGLKYGTGYAGSTTIKKLTAIYGCGVTPTPIPTPTPVPVAPYIKVISPNGDETWKGGGIYGIKWSSAGVDKVKISVCGDTPLLTKKYSCWELPGMGFGVKSNGVYTWKISPNAPYIPSDKLKIRITDYESENLYDESDSYFSIVAASSCTKEGKTGVALNGDVCCNGLTSILNSRPSGTVCVAPTNSSFMCSYCGNGVCGLGENSCNCPADCSTQTEEPSVTVISPNGGEVWKAGGTYNIQWSAPDITRVSIDVLDGVTGKVTMISPEIIAVVPNTGNYQWSIPSAMASDNYKVRVLGCPESFSNTACANVGMNDYGYDESDSYFSIVGSAPAQFTCSALESSKSYYFDLCERNNYENVCFDRFRGTYQGCYNDSRNECTEFNVNAHRNIGCPVAQQAEEPSITVTSPNGGETWSANNSYTIKWSALNMANSKINIDLINQTCIGNLSAGSDIEQCIKAISHGISPARGLFSWTNIPIFLSGTWESGNQFKVRITEVKSTGRYGAQDESDSNFSIVESAVAACTDSDGGKAYYVKGTTKGIAGDGLISVDTDRCVGDKLVEWFCYNVNYRTNTNYVCPNGCANGACVTQVEETTITITEPKNGATITGATNIKATAKSASALGDMYLTIAQGQGAGILKFQDCSASEGGSSSGSTSYTKNCSYLWQNLYDTYKDGSIKFTASITDSSGNEFKNSIDVIYESENVTSCTDSDGGKAYYVKGIVTYDGNNYTDYCRSDGTIMEYFCQESPLGPDFTGLGQDYLYTCPNGCDNGACKKAVTDLTITGRLVDKITNQPVANVKIYTDTASGGRAISPVYSDSQGRFEFQAEKGVVKMFPFWPDCYMQSSLVLQSSYTFAGKEWFVSSIIFDSDSKKTPVTGDTVDVGDFPLWPAVDIHTYSDVPSQFNIQYKVRSSFGGYNGAGNSNYTQSHTLSNSIPLDYDVRIKFLDRYGREYYSPFTKFDLENECKDATLNFTGGQYTWGACGNSICEAEQNTCPVDCASAPTCTDSDGGEDYYTKGYVKSGNTTAYDYCVDTQQLSEAICAADGNPDFVSFDCLGGCDNGACAEAVAEVGSLDVSIDASNPLSQEVVEETVGFTFLKVAFDADSAEDIKVDSVALYAHKLINNAQSSATADDINIAIFDNDTVLGPLLTIPNNDGAVVFSNLNWVIPKATTKLLTVKGDVVYGTGADKLKLVLDTDKTNAVGMSSDAQIVMSNNDIEGNWMTIVEPVLGLNDASSQLANIAQAVNDLMKRVEELLGR